MLSIVRAPHPALVKPVKTITRFDSKLRRLILDMEETLIAQEDPPGVGLAATQVGLSLSLFIMKPTPQDKTTVCINPVILEKKEGDKTKSSTVNKDGDEEDVQMEGCLSIPRIWGPVTRFERILLSYQDVDGANHNKWFSGFEAVIIQHEVDHLHGVLFTQRVLEQNQQLYREKGDSLEPIEVGTRQEN